MELTKTPWLYSGSQRKIYFHLCALCFPGFFTAKDGFLERLSLSSHLYFIAADKRSLLAAVDRNGPYILEQLHTGLMDWNSSDEKSSFLLSSQ